MTGTSAPDISIITRTKDRTLMLERCLRTVASQTYQGRIEWVIVNDGGEKKAVEQLLNTTNLPCNCCIKVVNNDRSVGRAKAANIGCCSSSAKYLVLLDDDDTWASSFIEQTLGFLQQYSAHYQSVSVHAQFINEKLENNRWIEKERSEAMFNSESISLASMCAFNRLVSNGVVFTRSTFEALNGFDEKLSFLEDYDFFLRLLLIEDIAVLPKKLAFVHVREQEQGELSLPRYWKVQNLAAYKNIKLRQDMLNGTSGLGTMLFNAEVLGTVERFNVEWRNRNNSIASLLSPRRLLSRILGRQSS